MAPSFACVAVVAVLVVVAQLSHGAHGHRGGGAPAPGARLSSSFYDESCPSAYDVVRREIQRARLADPRIPASLIRLHFHDCFVNGCDASLLLDDDLPAFESEKHAPGNDNSARGFPVVEDIKRALDRACPGVVSCADVLALAAEISVHVSGGPHWRVLLGRRDGTAANIDGAMELPNFFDPLEKLISKFTDVGLDETDLVALQGAHTFGKTNCLFTQENCTAAQHAGGESLALEDLDPVTPDVFDNKYYGSLLRGAGQLPSDQIMVSDPAAAATTAPIVRRFAGSQKDFFRNFAVSMVKMGNIAPLTGRDGQIRINTCLRVNRN